MTWCTWPTRRGLRTPVGRAPSCETGWPGWRLTSWSNTPASSSFWGRPARRRRRGAPLCPRLRRPARRPALRQRGRGRGRVGRGDRARDGRRCPAQAARAPHPREFLAALRRYDRAVTLTVTCELVPPRGADRDAVRATASQWGAIADAVNVTDGARASVRMS